MGNLVCVCLGHGNLDKQGIMQLCREHDTEKDWTCIMNYIVPVIYIMELKKNTMVYLLVKLLKREILIKQKEGKKTENKKNY